MRTAAPAALNLSFSLRPAIGSLRRSRLEWANWTTSVAHLALLGFAAQSSSRPVWGVCLLLVAAISLLAWSGNFRRYRAILDTPTSRIESAAQGYVELSGQARWPGEVPLLSQLRQVPCCWYWFRIEKQGHKDRWTVEQEGESAAPFLLDDGSGQCIVHPAEAEVHSSRRERWRVGSRRCTELTILPGDRVYAIGELTTLRAPQGRAAVDAGVAARLAEWKRDRAGLRARFDLDRDGEIDLQEWALARRQARREAEQEHAAAAPAPAVHVMRRPRDRRLFMLSNMDAESLARRYRWWKWLHLAIFFAGLGTGTWLLAS